MKFVSLLSAIFFYSILYAGNPTINLQDGTPSEPKELQFRLEGSICNLVTGQAVEDKINVDVLTPDSIVIASGQPVKNTINGRNSEIFRLFVTGIGTDFIVRLSHPDYETVFKDIQVNGPRYDMGVINIRRLSNFEKSLMLGEVTVKASVLQFINKGDTVQYNADAFQVAQGSMLDALIEQLPGVELKDNGRIYVNGRFVEKLLLDGKDFFQGDKLVLLQNLPAYTVKDVQVYEKANGIAEVTGRKGAAKEDYMYVMDVRLRKGYNTGWMANAEAAGGTHHRYRGRAFGLGYTKTLRLGAYGFINNLNETRNPGRNGNWSPADSRKGLTNTKGGGITYGYFKGQSIELTGQITTSYNHSYLNSQTSTQNFITGGDTYTQRWSNNISRDLTLQTSHTLVLRPQEGSNYNHTFTITGGYDNNRKKTETIEGSFTSLPADILAMKEKLEEEMPVGNGIINRYLNYVRSNQHEWSVKWEHQSTVKIKNTSHAFILQSYGDFTKGHSDASNDYLLQYTGNNPTQSYRNNPELSHSYDYWIGGRLRFNLTDAISVTPTLAYSQKYSYNDNSWYHDSEDEALNHQESVTDDKDSNKRHISRSMLLGRLMQLDPRNSYVTGLHRAHEFACLILTYFKEERRNNQQYRVISVTLSPGVNFINDKLDFTGLINDRLRKKYASVESSLRAYWSSPRQEHTLALNYNIQGQSYYLMDMIDITFDYDPLNIRKGNPNLKEAINHSVSLNYDPRKWFGKWLRFDAQLEWERPVNEVVMAYNYNHLTGVRTYIPTNVNGSNSLSFKTWQCFSFDPGVGHHALHHWITLSDNHMVDITSSDMFATVHKNIVKSRIFSDALLLQWNFGNHMIGANSSFKIEHASSDRNDFRTFNITSFSYGVQCRFLLPYKFEISSDLKMYSNRGYDYHEMNTNQLVWNARISKQLLKGQLMVALDGYDILGNVKSINYNISSQARTETWVNSIPSYVMLSVKWNFSKKPRE